MMIEPNNDLPTLDATLEMPTLRPAISIDGYHLPDTMTDVRGWSVMAGDAEIVGSVRNLMIGTTSNTVRWLALDLADELLDDRTEARCVLVPVGHIRYMRNIKTLSLVSIAIDELRRAPHFAAGKPVTRELEDLSLAAFGLATSRDIGDEDLYRTPAFKVYDGLTAPPPKTIF